jgi:hypothetical protein
MLQMNFIPSFSFVLLHSKPPLSPRMIPGDGMHASKAYAAKGIHCSSMSSEMRDEALGVRSAGAVLVMRVCEFGFY